MPYNNMRSPSANVVPMAIADFHSWFHNKGTKLMFSQIFYSIGGFLQSWRRTWRTTTSRGSSRRVPLWWGRAGGVLELGKICILGMFIMFVITSHFTLPCCIFFFEHASIKKITSLIPDQCFKERNYCQIRRGYHSQLLRKSVISTVLAALILS